MKKHSLLSSNSGTFTSPGTPDYRDGNPVGILKGWSSERVPPSSNSSRRHISAPELIPFNSGRTLPSKWVDAERWITSPVSGFGVNKVLVAQPHGPSKSKSGPLGAQGVGCFSNHSPAMPMLQGGSVRDFMAGSPFTTGVIVPPGLSIHYGGHNIAKSNPVNTENIMARVVSLPGWSDMLSEPSLTSSQDKKPDGVKDEETMASHVVLLRDMATQMSPEDSACSSLRGRSSFCTSPPSILPIDEPHGNHSAKLEIRDVQVDKSATMTRQSKKHRVKKTRDSSPDFKDLTSSWDISVAAKDMSKLRREEAKITAWENLEKAKAEAAMQKLEMKLEKKRSASMDKIMNKLRIAQMKAQEMRSSMPGSHTRPEPKASHKVAFFHKFVKMGSVLGCFTGHAS